MALPLSLTLWCLAALPPAHLPLATGLSAPVSADMPVKPAAAPAPKARPPRGKRPPEAEPVAAAPPPAYTAELAQADLDRVLAGRGKEYIDARGRLEANPAIAAPQIAARLAGTPAPTQVEQRRLLAVLGAVARPEDVRLFADALRRDVAAAQNSRSQEQGIELLAAEPWREVLRAQGQAAAPIFTELVAEKSFSEELRALLLADLVVVTPAERLPDLVALVGLGAPTLRHALRQAIARRAQASVAERRQLIEIVDAALAASEPARKAGLVLLRAALGDAGDAAFTRAAAAIAEDDAAVFPARAAAVRVLVARRSDPVSQDSLDRLVAAHLAPARRGEQASEILGALALAGLEPARAAARVDGLDLTRAESPRIAAAAWAAVKLPAGAAWLDASQQHAWPEVRAAALARVDAPCEQAILERLRGAVDLAGPRNEPDAAVSREAIAALGRCGGDAARTALTALVSDAAQGVERRAEAARQLVDRHGAAGSDAVAAALRGAEDPSVGLRLVRALQRAEAPATAPVRDALCAAAGQEQLAAAARRALRDLLPDEETPCGPR